MRQQSTPQAGGSAGGSAGLKSGPRTQQRIETSDPSTVQITGRQQATGAWSSPSPKYATPASKAKGVKDPTMPLYDQYPDNFYAPRKENLFILHAQGAPGPMQTAKAAAATEASEQMIIDTPTPVARLENTGDVEIVEADDSAKKNKEIGQNESQVTVFLINKDTAICGFLYGCSWFASWVALNAAGGRQAIDTRTRRYAALRDYSLKVARDNKYTFITRRTIPYVREWGARREQAALADMNLDDEYTKNWIR